VYDNSVAHPLVVVFHGAGAGSIEQTTGFSNTAITIGGKDVIVVYGQSTMGTNGETGEPRSRLSRGDVY
jgi:poly(3-hydroxybutyrate) depolymerase